MSQRALKRQLQTLYAQRDGLYETIAHYETAAHHARGYLGDESPRARRIVEELGAVVEALGVDMSHLEARIEETRAQFRKPPQGRGIPRSWRYFALVHPVGEA